MAKDNFQQFNAVLEENLKKALTELLILHLLCQRDYFVGELTGTLKQKSNGILKLVFPYSAIYRLQEVGCITSGEKRIAADGRKRQFYSITQLGRTHYKILLESYQHFTQGVNMVLDDTTN